MKQILLFFFIFQSVFLFSQATIDYCSNPKFEKAVERYISHSVEVISVDELNETFDQYVLLDAREVAEFETSKIPGAKYFGYDNPDFSILDNLDKEQPIVMYCSIGYRSEKMGEELQKRGFTNVKNLYGSIFEWANKNYPLVDSKDENTTKIHTYNSKWGKWVENKNLEKVY